MELPCAARGSTEIYRNRIREKWSAHEIPAVEFTHMSGRRVFLRVTDREELVNFLEQCPRFDRDGFGRLLFHGPSATRSWREAVPYDSLHITEHDDGTFEVDIDEGNPYKGWKPAAVHLREVMRNNQRSAMAVALTAAINSRFFNWGHPYRTAIGSVLGGLLCCAAFGLLRLRHARMNEPLRWIPDSGDESTRSADQ